MKPFFCFLFLFIALFKIQAQEFNLQVKVNTPRLQVVDPKVFQTFEKELFDFFNDTKWTEDEFEDHEKIEGNINVTVTEETSSTSFKVDIFIQTIRPVFNSNYKSQILNYADKGVNIVYRESQPIQNSMSNYIDPLSSLFTFYAYLMLAYDYDTFSSLGGDTHLKTAETIINSLPQSAAEGTAWDQQFRDNKSRFKIINNLLDPRGRPLREAMYEYHLKGLDTMHEDAGKARAIMVSSITSIGGVNQAIRNSGIVQMFTDSKKDELIEIFKGGDRGQQTKVYELMITMDPARTSEYGKIK